MSYGCQREFANGVNEVDCGWYIVDAGGSYS